MDFQQLLAKMQELDRPVPESQVAECPPAMGPAEPPMGMDAGKPDTPPPSMSLNLNAQGMDNIEQLMALIKAVNPDTEKPEMPPLPTMGMEPSIATIKPSMPPLKMLPDLDADNDDMPGGELDAPKTMDVKFGGDEEGEEGEGPEDDENEKEAFGNSLNGSEPEEKGNPFDAEGNDLHKPKKMFPKAQDGDNPMAVEGTDLRSQIRAELLRRLAEAKGAK